MRGGILVATTGDVHRPRSNSPLHFDNRNIWQIHTEKQKASVWRLLPADVLERWPHVCRVKITFTLLTKLLRFHNNECDETHCKLKSIENRRLFEKYPAPPYPLPRGYVTVHFFSQK